MRRTALLLLSTLLLTQPVMASTPEEAEKKIEELEKQRDEINQQIADLRAEYTEWKHYEDEFISFDYPVKPYEISISWLGDGNREYIFKNPYTNLRDFVFSFVSTEWYKTPDERFECDVKTIDDTVYYLVYNADGDIARTLNTYEVNDQVVLEVDVRISDESLPVGDKLLGSATFEYDVTPDMFSKKDERSESIQENFFFSDEKIEDIEAVISLAEKYLNMEATKQEVDKRIQSYSSTVSDAYLITFYLTSSEDQKIREVVRELKRELDDQLPPKD